MIKTDLTGAAPFIDVGSLRIQEGRRILEALRDGRIGRGGAGWLDLPRTYGRELSEALYHASHKIAAESAALVVVGIGGSYLGARAAIDLIKSPHYNQMEKKTPDIYFAGNNLSGDHLEQVIALLGNRDFSVSYVSKSGGTLEPSAAFRVFKGLLTEKYGAEGAARRIYVTTDAARGKLRALADREGYTSFVIPEDVGGRYSVLTPVGLLPAAVAGIDIDDIMAGALAAAENGGQEAVFYAAARQALYGAGKKIEILCGFEPSFRFMGEWWKQLFGESEGKDAQGIFPAYLEFTADLHSLGQYIQSGERTLFETFVRVEKSRSSIRIPGDPSIDDGLDKLTGRRIGAINDTAAAATKAAHIEGGVPVIELHMPECSAYYYGALVCFFEMACAVSALLSGVEPFGQPGVEAYKKNLFGSLGLS